MKKSPSQNTIETLMKEKRKLQVFSSLFAMLLLGFVLIVIGLSIQNISTFWSAAFREIGLIFAPTAVLGLLYEYYAQRDHAKEIASTVADFLEYELEHRLGGRLADSDVVAIYPARHAIDFHEYFKQSTNSIDILTTNLQSMEMYLGLLIEQARQGIQIRVLSLNPTHEFTKKRFVELGFKESQSFSEEMMVSLKHFCIERDIRLSSVQQKNLLIKVYDNPPSLMMFRRDYHIIIGFILQQGRSRDLLHIEFDFSTRKDRPALSRAFLEHYEILWSHGKEIDLDILKKIAKDS